MRKSQLQGQFWEVIPCVGIGGVLPDFDEYEPVWEMAEPCEDEYKEEWLSWRRNGWEGGHVSIDPTPYSLPIPRPAPVKGDWLVPHRTERAELIKSEWVDRPRVGPAPRVLIAGEWYVLYWNGGEDRVARKLEDDELNQRERYEAA